jgi:DNA-binding NtrC family response regulator
MSIVTAEGSARSVVESGIENSRRVSVGSPMRDTPYSAAKEKALRSLIRRFLIRHGGNRTRTARSLGIDRPYLQQLIKRYKLKD